MQRQSRYVPHTLMFVMVLFGYYTYANSVLNHPDTWRIIVASIGFTILFSLLFWFVWVKEAWGQ